MKLAKPLTMAVATAMLIASAPLAGADESTSQTTCKRMCYSNGCNTTCTTTSTYTPPAPPVRNGRLDGLLNDRSPRGVAIWNTR